MLMAEDFAKNASYRQRALGDAWFGLVTGFGGVGRICVLFLGLEGPFLFEAKQIPVGLVFPDGALKTQKKVFGSKPLGIKKHVLWPTAAFLLKIYSSLEQAWVWVPKGLSLSHWFALSWCLVDCLEGSLLSGVTLTRPQHERLLEPTNQHTNRPTEILKIDQPFKPRRTSTCGPCGSRFAFAKQQKSNKPTPKDHKTKPKTKNKTKQSTKTQTFCFSIFLKTDFFFFLQKPQKPPIAVLRSTSTRRIIPWWFSSPPTTRKISSLRRWKRKRWEPTAGGSWIFFFFFLILLFF